MYIAEKWTDEVRLKIVKRRLKFDHMFNVPRVNRGGGLVLFWEDSMNLQVKTPLKNHIDCIVGAGIEGEVQKTRSSLVRTIPLRPLDQTPRCDPRPIWKPPPWSKLKVNFDGSVFRENQRAGVGVIV